MIKTLIISNYKWKSDHPQLKDESVKSLKNVGIFTAIVHEVEPFESSIKLIQSAERQKIGIKEVRG